VSDTIRFLVGVIKGDWFPIARNSPSRVGFFNARCLDERLNIVRSHVFFVSRT